MSARMLNFSPELTQYLRTTGIREPDALAGLREETQKMERGMMQISPEQGAFMANLVRIMGARRTLEVGTFTGYSALAVALALPGEGRVVACDVSDEWTAIGRRYWQQAGVESKIDLHLAPAVETLDGFIRDGQQGTFDFAFIDADKSNYDRYYEQSLELVREGGVIAIDNVLWNGAVIDDSRQDDDTKAIRELNDKVRKDARITLSMLPIGDGLTLAVKLPRESGF